MGLLTPFLTLGYGSASQKGKYTSDMLPKLHTERGENPRNVMSVLSTAKQKEAWDGAGVLHFTVSSRTENSSARDLVSCYVYGVL